MTDSKRSAPSASSSRFKCAEAPKKRSNALNAMYGQNIKHLPHHLYGGMLYPSRVVAVREVEASRSESK